MKKGFTIFANGKDYFFVTDRKYVTESVVKQVCRHLNVPDNQWGKHEARCHLRKATLEVKGQERKYFEISGDGFGGRGSFCDDGMTVVVELD